MFGPTCDGELPGVDVYEWEVCVWHTVLGERRAWCLVLQLAGPINEIVEVEETRREKNRTPRL